MENLIYSCPICHGHVLAEDLATPPGAQPSEIVAKEKLYCPHCEMLVTPTRETEEQREQEGVEGRDAGTENHGRNRESGTNAGGSQRGDLSDEGASQWRVDPGESLRNTWDDKPLRPRR
jgi:hypothetical protein